ncbi:MAG: hypothetical protein DBY45_10085 [Clostridiales bacterium]|nr:MAG: hypothetical protein DBY45_10085 [Clostridiales bacterium]
MGDYMGKRTGTAKWNEKQQRWIIKVQKDGTRKSFYSSKPGRTGQREANAKADNWLDENIDSYKLRVEELYNDYQKALELTTSKSNCRNIESFGRIWLLPAIGHMRINSLNEYHFQNILSKAYAKGLSKKTLQNMRAMMISFVKYCRIRRATNLSFEDLSIPKDARSKPKNILQPKDLQILFTVDTTILNGKRKFDEYVYAYRFQVLTGLRPGELLGLRWTDICDNIVHVNRSINVDGDVTKGKNENALRRFIMSPQAQEVIEKQRELYVDEDSVFGITNMRNYHKRWKKYCNVNGITPLSLYELRHTFVSVTSSLPEKYIKTLVGHSKNMDTYGVYGHEVEGEQNLIASKIGEVFNDILNVKEK